MFGRGARGRGRGRGQGGRGIPQNAFAELDDEVQEAEA